MDAELAYQTGKLPAVARLVLIGLMLLCGVPGSSVAAASSGVGAGSGLVVVGPRGGVRQVEMTEKKSGQRHGSVTIVVRSTLAHAGRLRAAFDSVNGAAGLR